MLSIFYDEPKPAPQRLLYFYICFNIIDPGQAPRPLLRLVLDHTTKNPDAATTATVWNPEDEQHGHLELSSVEDLRIDGITIHFEGEIQGAIKTP